jgi:hypothetical protein
MIIEAQPLAEITQTAIHLLCQQMGVVNTIRFLNQFTTGYGNYTGERDALLGHLTVAEVADEIRRSKVGSNAGPNAPEPSGDS